VVKLTDRAARKRRGEGGTSTVEAVIVLPIMLMLVFGIAEFGISFTRWNSLTNAVREGARVGVVFRSPCNDGPVETLVADTVANFANSSGIDPVDITTTVTGACTGTGTQLTVDATVPYDFIALDALADLVPSVNLSARTVMRNE
jgi:Flp pilus assembly protein TadG